MGCLIVTDRAKLARFRVDGRHAFAAIRELLIRAGFKYPPGRCACCGVPVGKRNKRPYCQKHSIGKRLPREGFVRDEAMKL